MPWRRDGGYGKLGLEKFRMLYYAALLVFWLVVGLFLIWLCREGLELGRKFFGHRPGGVKHHSSDLIGNIPLNTRINQGPAAWGRSEHETPAMEARTHATIPSKSTLWGGWPLDESEGCETPAIFADPNRSKTESEFWRYQVAPDVESHGTGSSRE